MSSFRGIVTKGKQDRWCFVSSTEVRAMRKGNSCSLFVLDAEGGMGTIRIVTKGKQDKWCFVLTCASTVRCYSYL